MNGSDDVFWGVTIAGSEVIAVGMRAQQPPLITEVGRATLARPFDSSTVRDAGVKEALVEAILRLPQEGGRPRRVALAISDRLAVVKCLPIDRGLQKEEIADHVRWEVEQLVAASGQEYVVDSSYVAMADGTHDRLVVVAIRRPIIDTLKQVGQQAGLRLAAVDLDLFAALRAIVHNHQLAQSKTTGVLRLSSTAATLVLLHSGELYEVCEMALPAGGEAELTSWDEPRAPDLWEELQRRGGNGTIERLLVYGSPAPQAFVDKLRPQCTVPVELANPVQRLQLAPGVGTTGTLLSGANFVAAVGEALRGVPRAHG